MLTFYHLSILDRAHYIPIRTVIPIHLYIINLKFHLRISM